MRYKSNKKRRLKIRIAKTCNKKYWNTWWIQKEVIKLFNEYSEIVSEAKYRAEYGEGLKILTPKQVLQRLQIALTQVLLNENRAKKLLQNI